MNVPIKPKSLRIPPQSIEAERALLGSVMLRPEVVHDLMDIVNTQSFYMDRHRMIWQTMMELFAKGTPIDLLSLSSRLKEKSILEQVGGSGVLSEMVGSVPSSTNAKHYGEIIQKKYMMRRLIDASEHIGELGFNEAGELEELLDQAEKKIFE
ncbi:MAG TPA: DnaB-like helicase N-terminal domain-containing protein, partial [Candidatus Paceibacterota bacterium]